MVTPDRSDFETLASKAVNFEQNSESFTVADLTSVLSHFRSVEAATGDRGSLDRKEFKDCFALVGIEGFLVDVLFEGFTWDNSFGVSLLNIKFFLSGFALLTKGSAEEKLSVLFDLYDVERSNEIGTAAVYSMFSAMHPVLIRLSRTITPDLDSFANEMMEMIHKVVSVDGRPVQRVTFQQLFKCCQGLSDLVLCLDSLRTVADGDGAATGVELPVLSQRNGLYFHAGASGVHSFFARCCPGLYPDPPLTDDVLQMTQRLTVGPSTSVLDSPKAEKQRPADWLFGRESWNAMLSFLMGVRRSVEKIALQDPKHLPASKREPILVPGPSPFSTTRSGQLELRDYSPLIFHEIRKLYNISDEEFLASLSPLPILGNLLLGNLRRLSSLISEGKSGSLLYFTHDKKYVIKTIPKREHVAFLGILRSYYDYVRSNPNTLITRFVGLYDLTLYNGKTIYFTIMANVFETPLAIHRRFDLKGSTVGRSATNKSRVPSHALPSVCLKDNDLDFRFLIPLETRRDLILQIASDANWLSANKLIDYSLLIGIHEIDKAGQTKPLPGAAHHLDLKKIKERTKDHRCRFQRYLGGMPCTLSNTDQSECILFAGIIDCFTKFGPRKCLERGVKILGGQSAKGMSVMPPEMYQARFVDSMAHKVFGDDPPVDDLNNMKL
eukprot:c8474_g1_i2.p1 GENE.c8474_g1_i2~~c8474_g1_i2.p1  ORF type:complete len:707 (+),score=164.23 c8474_g1_i2:125-2122(+)